MALLVNGKFSYIPPGIGIDEHGKFIAELHTHDSSGIIHVESPVIRDYTLGEFFDVWGLRFSSHCLGGYCETAKKHVFVWANGKRVTKDPRKVVLGDHLSLVVAYGTLKSVPMPIPSTSLSRRATEHGLARRRRRRGAGVMGLAPRGRSGGPGANRSSSSSSRSATRAALATARRGSSGSPTTRAGEVRLAQEALPLFGANSRPSRRDAPRLHRARRPASRPRPPHRNPGRHPHGVRSPDRRRGRAPLRPSNNLLQDRVAAGRGRRTRGPGRPASARGSAVRDERRVNALVPGTDGVRVETDRGPLEAETVVVAGGAWARPLLAGAESTWRSFRRERRSPTTASRTSTRCRR